MSNLEGINYFGDYSLDDIIEKNVIEYIKYGLLEIGAFYNNIEGTGNYRGVPQYLLHPLKAPNKTSFTTYLGSKSDWVWERNISLKYVGPQPTTVNGISINTTFVPTGTSVSGASYYVDYIRGGVVFSSGMASGTSVTVSHSTRAVGVYPAYGPEYRKLVFDWNAVAASGFNENYYNYAYLPAIFVHIRSMNTPKGKELGSRGKQTLAAFQFDCLASTQEEAKKLADICYMLETKTFKLFDIQNAPKPLNYSGQIVNYNYDWKYLTQNYPLGVVRFAEDARVTKSRDLAPLFHSVVTISLEVDTYPL